MLFLFAITIFQLLHQPRHFHYSLINSILTTRTDLPAHPPHKNDEAISLAVRGPRCTEPTCLPRPQHRRSPRSSTGRGLLLLGPRFSGPPTLELAGFPFPLCIVQTPLHDQSPGQGHPARLRRPRPAQRRGVYPQGRARRAHRRDLPPTRRRLPVDYPGPTGGAGREERPGRCGVLGM